MSTERTLKRIPDIKIHPAIAKKMQNAWEAHDPTLSDRDNLVSFLYSEGIDDAEYVASKLLLGVTESERAALTPKSKEEAGAAFISEVTEMLKNKPEEERDNELSQLLALLGISDYTCQQFLSESPSADGSMVDTGEEIYEKLKQAFDEQIAEMTFHEKLEELTRMVDDNAFAITIHSLKSMLKNPNDLADEETMKQFRKIMLQDIHSRKLTACYFAAAEYVQRRNGATCDLPEEIDDPATFGYIFHHAMELTEEAQRLIVNKDSDFEAWVDRLLKAVVYTLIALLLFGLPLLLPIAPMVACFVFIALVCLALLIGPKSNELEERFKAWLSYKKNPASRLLREAMGLTKDKRYLDKKNLYGVPSKEKEQA